MNELYAKIGQQHLTIEAQDAAYNQLLGVLAQVVNGKIERSRVLVNLTARTWMVSEPGTTPSTPATFNGLPEVVIAPAEATNPPSAESVES